jgi:exopolysaccharide biosynthesis predicted pyruvyltransferase EpsI
MTATTPIELKQELHTSLSSLEHYPCCALLDYPDHLNIGDSLIWLGTVHYLTDIANTKIGYAASRQNFCPIEMEKQIGDAPIFLHGGGNFGDLWPEHQLFRERIISSYHDRPIVMLPQAIQFQDPANLARAVEIFNAHPNLTIFLRDEQSYQIASGFFDKCRVFKASDMALQLIDLPHLMRNDFFTKSSSILYLCRKDRELGREIDLSSIDVTNVVVEDWISFQSQLLFDKTRKLRQIRDIFLVKSCPLVGHMLEDTWQKYLQLVYSQEVVTPQIYNPSIYYFRALMLTYRGIDQLRRHRLAIVNRLHAHILCTLLEIPNILLPNSYHKNQSFYQTWTSALPLSRFVDDPLNISLAVRELLES